MTKLSERSRRNLVGVHADLVRVVRTAHKLTEGQVLSFIVTSGVRTPAEQAKLVASGASTTTNSRHLSGHAVDLAATVEHAVRWDWPLYDRLYEIMLRASEMEKVPIEWGGHWKTFRDGPHYQLPWKEYPL